MKRFVILLFAMLFVLCGCERKVIYIQDARTVSEDIYITFIDMKYGSATLIESEKADILIGCGGAEDFPELYEYLRSKKVTKLDAVIITKTNDSGFQKVMANFEVCDVYVPDESPDISVYRTVTELVPYESNFYRASEGTRIFDNDGLYVDVVSSGLYDKKAFMSLYVSYGDISFLMEGDGDLVAERELILGVGELIKADVLAVPHCGTQYLPSEEFIETVNPTYAVIPVYGDGTPQLTLQRQLSQKVQKILRTDIDGTVTFVTDGKNIECHHSK